jgi:hypothetical protein
MREKPRYLREGLMERAGNDVSGSPGKESSQAQRTGRYKHISSPLWRRRFRLRSSSRYTIVRFAGHAVKDGSLTVVGASTHYVEVAGFSCDHSNSM